MTRKTETVHKALQYEPNQGKHLYGVHLHRGFGDTVQLHRFYVPGLDDENVQVLGLWRESETCNLLLRPVALHYLNILQQWFDWGTSWGLKIELEHPAKLTAEVTMKIDRPYVDSKLDDAYIAWLKKYPGGSPESWGAYAANHVKDGRVECEISRCEEPVVAGSTCCAEHQKFA